MEWDSIKLKQFILDKLVIPSKSDDLIVDGVSYSHELVVENINNIIKTSKVLNHDIESTFLTSIINYLDYFISDKIL